MMHQSGLVLDRIAALQGVTFLPGSPHKRFARDIGRIDPRKFTRAQVRHVEHLAWRYRRQMPAHLVPPADPYAPFSADSGPDAAANGDT
ncbi:hypothetical protein [Xanthobacter sp. 91]|uniref:hypothetical protein n=1 Tax=Xanthobacter sp. 91 TaxID=1117244 RepID=UPI0004960170|nr:hypothetical protein [Xanthobacter sp. 91]